MAQTHRTDGERARDLATAKLVCDDNWLLGRIGDATYLRSLMILGHGDKEARTELNLLKIEKKCNARREFLG